MLKEECVVTILQWHTDCILIRLVWKYSQAGLLIREQNRDFSPHYFILFFC